MKKVVISIFDSYCQFRADRPKSTGYRIVSFSLAAIFAAYFFTICYPQYLFAHHLEYKNFSIYSREPLDESIYAVLDATEAKLSTSAIYDPEISHRVFLTNGFRMYAFLSVKALWSFGNSIPGFNNIYINKSDTANDLIFVNRDKYNVRSLSSVIAHELTHLLIRKRVGIAREFFSLPNWKDEGYCEYVAGGPSVSYEEGVKLWKESPDDDSEYRYFKYQLMVKYLLETDKLTIDDFFNRDFDQAELAAKVFSRL